MLVSHKYKFLKIDIPKTGSRSFRENMRDYLDVIGSAQNVRGCFRQHSCSLLAKEAFMREGWDWENYFKFTIVRNPWARYASCFFYLYSKVTEYRSLLRTDPDSIKEWSLPRLNLARYWGDAFERQDYDQHKMLESVILHFPSQDSYFLDEAGNIALNHVGSFEKMEEEHRNLCNKLKLSMVPLQHCNKGVYSLDQVREIFTQELIYLVAQKESFVISMKGYLYE